MKCLTTIQQIHIRKLRQCANIVHLLPKDLRFEQGATKLVSCPERHLTSVRPWTWLKVNHKASTNFVEPPGLTGAFNKIRVNDWREATEIKLEKCKRFFHIGRYSALLHIAERVQ